MQVAVAGKGTRMSQIIPTSFTTATDIIEHALLHAKHEISHCDLCDEYGAIGVAELELAMQSRLLNVRALIDAVYDPQDSSALMRSMGTIDYLVRESVELCMLAHWMDEGETEAARGA